MGWAACALARHVDALVVRDDASDDGTGMRCDVLVPLLLLTCPALHVYSGGTVTSSAAVRFRAQPCPCSQALGIS